jgi:hypothetical protein
MRFVETLERRTHLASIASAFRGDFLRIDAGGTGDLDSEFRFFRSESGFASGGRAEQTVINVDFASPNRVMGTYRTGASFSYAVPMTRGSYVVLMSFHEPSAVAIGQRTFDVFAEGRKVVSELDVFASRPVTGNTRTVVLAADVAVSDGTLNLAFQGVIGEAIVNAIQILPTATPATVAPYTPLRNAYLAQSGSPSEQVTAQAALDSVNLQRLRSAHNTAIYYANSFKGYLPRTIGDAISYFGTYPDAWSLAGAERGPRAAVTDTELAAVEMHRTDIIYLGNGRRFPQEIAPIEVLFYADPSRVRGDVPVVLMNGTLRMMPRAELATQINAVVPDYVPGAPIAPVVKPSKKVLASQANLRELSSAIRVYETSNSGQYPVRVSDLYRFDPSMPLSTFISPGREIAIPTGLSEDDAVRWINANTDYAFPMAGLNSSRLGILFYDAHLAKRPDSAVPYAFGDGTVGVAEWALVNDLQRSLYNPPAPTKVQALSMPGKVTVSWSSANPDATGFYVRRRVVGDYLRGQIIANVPATARQFVDTSAVPGERYEYMVLSYSNYSRFSPIAVADPVEAFAARAAALPRLTPGVRVGPMPVPERSMAALIQITSRDDSAV